MGVVDNKAFVAQVNRMLERAKTSGTVFITSKRYAYVKKGSAPAAAEPTTTFSLLYRAVYGKLKVSTLVAPAETSRFNQSYMTVVKGQMSMLKKKDRTRAKKTSAAAPAAKVSAPGPAGKVAAPASGGKAGPAQSTKHAAKAT